MMDMDRVVWEPRGSEARVQWQHQQLPPLGTLMIYKPPGQLRKRRPVVHREIVIGYLWLPQEHRILLRTRRYTEEDSLRSFAEEVEP